MSTIRISRIAFEVVGPTQYVQAISDTSKGSWTASSGNDLFAMVDESPISDSDYMVSSSNPSNDTAVLKLRALNTPEAGGKIKLFLRVKRA